MRTAILALLVSLLIPGIYGCGDNGTTPNEDIKTTPFKYSFEHIGVPFRNVWAFSPTRALILTGNRGLVEWRGTVDVHNTYLAPTGLDMTPLSIWASGTSNVFVTGTDADWSRGIIIHYDGNRWRELSHQFANNVGVVFGSSSSNVYLTANNGSTLARYNGSGWTEIYSPSTQVRGGWTSGPNDIWLQGSLNQVHHYDGTSWTETTVGPIDNWHGIWGSGSDDVYMINIYDIYHYDGTGWSRVLDGITQWLSRIDGSGPDNVYVTTTDNIILHYNGTTWGTQLIGSLAGSTPGSSGRAPMGWSGLSVLSGTHVAVVGDNGAFAVGDGTSWETTQARTNRTWYAQGGANGVLYAGSRGGTMLRNQGTQWESFPDPTGADILDIYAVHPDTVWMIARTATSGTVYRYQSGTWQNMLSQDDILGIWARAGNEAVVVGGHGVRRFDGSTWDNHYAGRMTAVWGSASNDVWAVGSYGKINHWDGTQWTDLMVYQDSTLFDIYGTAATSIVAVGTDGFIRHHDQSGWRIAETDSMGTLYSVWGSSRNDFWAVGSGVILRYNGSAWNNVNCELFAGWQSVWGRGGEVWFGGGADLLMKYRTY